MKYFLHDTNSLNDEKITELYMQFGYEGLGLFYTILEKFAGQEKPIKTDVLKSQLRVGKRLNKCWEFMEKIDLIQSSNGETFNKELLNFSENYQIKKEKTRKKVSQWRSRQVDKKTVTGYVPVSNHSKVKLSKVKEIREDIYSAFLLETDDEKYHAFVDFLFGKNDIDRPFQKCIFLSDQINYKKFNILMSKYSKELIKEKIMSMENAVDKKNTSFYSTLNNWCRMSKK